MSTILQGTTPTLVISINPEDVTMDNIDLVELVFHQTGHDYLVKAKEDCELNTEDNTISYHFTEEETLSFKNNKPLVYQLRLKTNDGEIIGTEKTEIGVIDLMRSVAMNE